MRKTPTLCVHPERFADPFGASVPPIYQTATFVQESATEFGEYDYTRSGNPTREALERHIARLEGGERAAAFASGMAAIAAVTRLVEQGDEILAGDDLYGGTARLLGKIAPRQGISVRYVDACDVDEVRRALTPRTRLVFVETPTNPLFRICDLRALARATHEAGALLAVDNSMLSPCFQKPLSLGADLAVHSATKFLGGHGDVTAGIVVARDEEVYRRVAFHQNAEGAGLAPFDSWLLTRGVKTLALRVERQAQSALRVAEFLAAHPAVRRVYYPGLPYHPGHATHRAQATGDGAVLSFATGDAGFSKRLAEATELFALAVSFGSVASGISVPCGMSHASVPEGLRDRLAPPADLVRLSVGIEDVDDLVDDLERAFAVAADGVARAIPAAARVSGATRDGARQSTPTAGRASPSMWPWASRPVVD